MKELENLKASKVEIHQEQNKKQEYKFIGNVHIKTGCKLWSYDSEKDAMIEVKISTKGAISLSGEVVESPKAQYNPSYIYFQAINEKNARKKLKKYREGDYDQAESFEKKHFESLWSMMGTNKPI